MKENRQKNTLRAIVNPDVNICQADEGQGLPRQADQYCDERLDWIGVLHARDGLDDDKGVMPDSPNEPQYPNMLSVLKTNRQAGQQKSAPAGFFSKAARQKLDQENYPNISE